MRKELYEKLNFEERCLYRIEDNGIHLDLVTPHLILLTTILCAILLQISGEISLALLISKMGVIFTAISFLASFFSVILKSSKQQKEWTKYILEKKNETTKTQ